MYKNARKPIYRIRDTVGSLRPAFQSYSPGKLKFFKSMWWKNQVTSMQGHKTNWLSSTMVTMHNKYLGGGKCDLCFHKIWKDETNNEADQTRPSSVPHKMKLNASVLKTVPAERGCFQTVLLWGRPREPRKTRGCESHNPDLHHLFPQLFALSWACESEEDRGIVFPGISGRERDE